MTRMKSYTAKTNRGRAGEVFVNNLMASHERQRKRRLKEAEQAAKRSESQRMKELKRRERERDQAEKRALRQANKEKAALDRRMAKEDLVANRICLELEKLNLFPGKSLAASIATEAVAAGITAAKAKSYFLDGKEDEIAKLCAIDLLEEEGFPAEFQHLDSYKSIQAIACSCRPQWEVLTHREFTEIASSLREEIDVIQAQRTRYEERMSLIEELQETKIMFGDEIEEFAEIIEKLDLGRDDSIESEHFQKFVLNKKNYVESIERQIQPFQLTRSSDA